MTGSLNVDAEGFLISLGDWTPEIAEKLAQQELVTLTDSHWQIVHMLRAYYQNFDHAPAMRPLIKYLEKHLGKDKANSIYLLTLFPGSPAKLAAKIAGLPKPPNCL